MLEFHDCVGHIHTTNLCKYTRERGLGKLRVQLDCIA